MAVAVQLQAPAGVAVVLALLLPETQPCKQKQVHMLYDIKYGREGSDPLSRGPPSGSSSTTGANSSSCGLQPWSILCPD